MTAVPFGESFVHGWTRSCSVRRRARRRQAPARSILCGLPVPVEVMECRGERVRRFRTRRHVSQPPASWRRAGRRNGRQTAVPFPNVMKAGGFCAHTGSAIGHRVWKRQPAGGSMGDGTSPVRTSRARDRLAAGSRYRVRRQQRQGVGMPGGAEDFVGRSLLRHLTEVHDHDPVGQGPYDREVVRHEEVGDPRRFLQLPHQAQNPGPGWRCPAPTPARRPR